MHSHHISLSNPLIRVMAISVVIVLFSLALTGCQRSTNDGTSMELLNVSYDPTRELYQELNPIFEEKWYAQTGNSLKINMSHSGSAKQARSVIDGLSADVVSLALEYDINAVARTGLVDTLWRSQFPHNSSPYTSTIVFLVRKGNPLDIEDWDDLIEPGIAVITPNPKTSGGARWNYLAAWAYATRNGESDDVARDFLTALYRNVPVLDSGARGATTTFVERQIGDVLLTWENEALLAKNELKNHSFEIIYPSVSILAEPPVAVVTANCHRHGTLECARAYVNFLYSDQAQEIIGKHYFRPCSPVKISGNYPDIKRMTIDTIAGGWDAAQKRHFDDGGEFDQIYQRIQK